LDSVILKPRRYLGDTWKDVNDVVRSLGGHWSRGQSSLLDVAGRAIEPTGFTVSVERTARGDQNTKVHT